MIDRGAQLGQPIASLHHLLARHVAALLRPHLVFEEHAGCTCLPPQLHGANGVERVAVPRVRVDHDIEPGLAAHTRRATSAISVCVR
jgi:hypothetical protein